MDQKIISPAENYRQLEDWIVTSAQGGPVLLVHGKSLNNLQAFNQKLAEITEKHHIKFVSFSDYSPNPKYESVVSGVESFRNAGCTAIIAAGGGSAIDVAKCIKLYSNMPGDGKDGSFLTGEIIPNEIPFLAMPMTAGTGSESTRYAVIYYEGNKQSVTHVSSIPDTILFDPDTLKSLPLYQKKATMCDALCHAVESYWSVNSTEESRSFSGEAIRMVMKNKDDYLSNSPEGNEGMLKASNLAGKAINITQTTAGHAMCYKITSLFGAAHGHASALCNRVLFPWMIENLDRCIDPRGADFLEKSLCGIADAMGCGMPKEAAAMFNSFFDSLDLPVPEADEEQFAILRTSVNPVRLKNHPVRLDEDTIDRLYHQILRSA